MAYPLQTLFYQITFLYTYHPQNSREDRGTNIKVKLKVFSMGLLRFIAENTEMKIMTNKKVITLNHTGLLLFECF